MEWPPEAPPAPSFRHSVEVLETGRPQTPSNQGQQPASAVEEMGDVSRSPLEQAHGKLPVSPEAESKEAAPRMCRDRAESSLMDVNKAAASAESHNATFSVQGHWVLQEELRPIDASQPADASSLARE